MKIIIVDNVHDILIEKFIKAGYNCHYQPDITKQLLLSIINEYDGLIIRSKIELDKELLAQLPKLKFIGRVGSGLENIDVEFAQSQGIQCFNSPEGNRDAVAEHTLGMLLVLLNKLIRADSEVRNGKWRRDANRGTEIKGKTIGIIGYGNMGSAFAQRLKGFEANVISYDKYKHNYSDGNTKEVDLQAIFEETDILSLHVPLTEETQFMVNDEFINKFQKNIYLINTSRGKIVKTNDLVKSLLNSKIIGAALDVLEYEKISFEELSITSLPPAYDYLLKSDKVVLSPHIAGITYESFFKLSDILADKIINALKK